MVRFARADGSKGSNKRQYEEPTPWTEMVSHLDHKDNNNKRKKNKEKVEKQTTKEKEESIGLGEQEQESRPQNAFQAATDTRAGEQEGDRLPAHPTQDSTHTNKKKKKEKQPAVPEYTINAEGKRVKVFRDGTQRTWFDLPYEESDTMTRYESMWVKKVMVAQLDRLKASLKEDDLDQKQIMKKMMKAKRKAHKELRIELIYQQKSLVSEATGGREKGEAVSRNKRKEKKHGSKGINKAREESVIIGEGGDGSWSSPHTHTDTHPPTHTREHTDQSVYMDAEEITGGGDDGDDMNAVVMTQPWGRRKEAGRERRADESNSKIERTNKVNLSEMPPSQVNTEDSEVSRGEDDKIMPVVTQGEEKAKKKSKSKKVKLETETVAEIATEGNAGDDSAVTVTAQSHDKPKKKRKKRVELRPEPETSQPYSDKEDTTETPQEDKPRKKRKKGVEVRPETEASQPYSDKQHITEEQQGENNQSFTKETDKLLPEKELTEAQEGENNQSFTKETDKLLPEKELTEAQEGENNQSFTKETEELLPEEELTEAQEGKSNTSFTKETDNMYDNDSRNAVNPSTSHPTFEENDVMTRYEGYWVLREEVMTLEDAKVMEVNAIYAARTSETGDKETETENKELTQEEQFVLQRAMKKRKRYHHRRLVTRLSRSGRKKEGEGEWRERGRGKEGKGGGDGDRVVRFDGFWIKKDAAERLHRLRKQLHGEGLSQQEVDALIQKERRKEERVLKNERKLVCLKCREPGHMVSACPTLALPQGETQPSICYTCGSTEHTSSTCNLKKGSADKGFSFATCYICGEAGHISRQCPDNPRGLYPKGGACRGCGSVEHLAKDCPDLQREKGETSIRVGRLRGEELEALEGGAEGQDSPPHTPQARHKPKVVTF